MKPRGKMKSSFGSRIEAMMEHKEALGFSASSYACLRGFDDYCQARFPDETNLTEELVLSWARKRENETVNTLNRRLAAMREFARYLISTGDQAYIYPQKMSPSPTRHIPHIFTDSELSKFFRSADSLSGIPGDALYQYVVPVMFRVIYCCGLRPAEGRLIKTRDMNLDTGKLHIRESKRHKDRAVMLSDDVRGLCNAYSVILKRTVRESDYFFPDRHGRPHGMDWLARQFRKCWNLSGMPPLCGSKPRTYDFRHTFATRWLQDCLDRNDDLHNMLPYLSAYMGHSSFSSTFYYIHLIPDRLKASPAIDWQMLSSLIPEVPL